jgi:proteasome-associated ATPase
MELWTQEESQMPRPQKEALEFRQLLSQLTTTGEGCLPLDQKLQILDLIRSQSAESSRNFDRFLIEQLCVLRVSLKEAMSAQQELRDLHRRLTSPPFHAAVFLGIQETDHGLSAMVACGNSRRIVACPDGLDADSLEPGDEVLLSNEMNFIISRSPFGALLSGHTAIFDRCTADGRIVLKDRDEEIVVNCGGGLKGQNLKSGDQIRWERGSCMALERIERPAAEALFLEQTPAESFECIGGLDQQIEQLQRPIRIQFFNAGAAGKYKLPRARSVLLTGPPGTGKTMMARALANWLGKLSKSGRARFAHFKPLEFCSMWWGESERILRDNFRALREAGEEDPDTPVVAFYDEIDSIGTARGVSVTHVDDRVLTAFMAELDGLESRGNILVVASTNRRDVLDPGLLRPGRLGDIIIEVPRPNMRAAREIFAKHLPADVPYAANGCGPAEARQFIIDSAVSRIYSPNGESELVQITFRDGKQRKVKASDLMNGASIANIARVSLERACLREIEEGSSGLRLEDVLHAIAGELESMANTLTASNCRNHLRDLPQDVDAVRVEPIRKKVQKSYRYIHVA